MQPSKNFVDVSLGQTPMDVSEMGNAGGVLRETSVGPLPSLTESPTTKGADTETNSGLRPEDGQKLSPLAKFCRALSITPEEKTFVERMWMRLGELGIVLVAEARGGGHHVTLSSQHYGELWVHYKGATTHRWEKYILTQNTASIRHALFIAKKIALYDLDEIRVAAGVITVNVREAPSEERFYSWYKPRPPMEEVE